MIFIPAIDLIEGKCVRLEQGNYLKKAQYSQGPVDAALSFQGQGARCIHIVDLDAAKGEGHENRGVIGKIVKSVDIPVQVGGGVRDRESITALLNLGIERVILGTIIVKNESYTRELVEEFGSRLAAGIDARDGIVRTSGWTEKSDLTALALGQIVKNTGFSLIIYTDIAKDGMLEGPDIEGIKKMAFRTGIPVIASGGISGIEDIKAVKDLEEFGVSGVIAGKAIYEGRISIREAGRILQGEETW